MGWSCRMEASETMHRWQEYCGSSVGSSNEFVSGGKAYFWEISRTEHDDGAITGSIFVMLGDGKCKQTGTFRINGDGSVARAPAVLKNL